MISKIHSILLIDPPHREASLKGRDARIVVGTQASGSCLRYGLEVRLHTDTTSSHKSLLCGGENKYAACLQCYFFPLLVICFISFTPLSPHYLFAIMSVQICQLVGLFNHTHHTRVSEKGRRRWELGKQHRIVLRTRALSASPFYQGLQIKLGKTTPASLWRVDQRYACLQLVLYPPAYFKKRKITGTNTARSFNKEKIWNFKCILKDWYFPHRSDFTNMSRRVSCYLQAF